MLLSIRVYTDTIFMRECETLRCQTRVYQLMKSINIENNKRNLNRIEIATNGNLFLKFLTLDLPVNFFLKFLLYNLLHKN